MNFICRVGSVIAPINNIDIKWGPLGSENGCRDESDYGHRRFLAKDSSVSIQILQYVECGSRKNSILV